MLPDRMADRRALSRMRVAASFPVLCLALAAAACSPAASPATSAVPTEAATPGVTAVPTQTSAPSSVAPTAPEATSGTAACTARDLKASHGIVEGAAGSRLTTVVLTDSVECAIDAFPAFGIRDTHGAELVGSVAGGTGRIELNPDVSYQVDVRFANWCGGDPAFPLKLELRIGAEEVEVTGPSFPEQGDMPPCNGSNGPELESGAWEPAP
jgi:hypothetical protein